jgi:branched-chain amino acid transport system substrate-binding protein
VGATVTSVTRRRVVAAAGAAAFAATRPARARAQGPRPIRIGLTCDQTGQFARSGQDELRGIRLAIDEANEAGGVLGRPIQWITQDTRTDPATAAAVARRFVHQEGCAILIGAVHSGVAEAITPVAADAGTIYFNTNSSSPTQAGIDCARVKFAWDANGTNFAKGAVREAMRMAGRRWVVLVNDYVWGHSTAAATRALVADRGGSVVQTIVVPPHTRDFSRHLATIVRLQPDVVATAVGGDDYQALRQEVVRAGLEHRPMWVGSQQDWPDIWGAKENLFGVFGTTWYHGLDLPGVPGFVAAWRRAHGTGPIPVPGNVAYNGYMATRELFRAMTRIGSTNNIALIRELEALRSPAAERMQHFDAWMDPRTHQLQQTVYLARRNPAPRDEADYYELLAWSPPEEVTDDSAARLCLLVPYNRVPVVDA